MPKQYHFFVKGMHCASCVLLTESAVLEDSRVTKAQSHLADRTIDIEGNFNNLSDEDVAYELTKHVQEHGYTFTTVGENEHKKWGEFVYAVPIALLCVVVFFLLQRFGIVNSVNTSKVTYGTAFLVGVVASLSTCMAVVGGLVLSLSASYAKEGERIKPQVVFHLGRLVSFFVLGGTIGVLGSVFQLGLTGTFIVGILIGVVMFILGINLLDIVHFTKRAQFTMPRFVSKHALALTKANHTATPAVVGVITFFLPCGFTQAMQIYTLSTGNFIQGAFTMFAFALGTFPVLALVSFSSFSITNKKTSGIFFKTAGLVVLFFALFNILNSLVAYGIIPPLFS